MNRLSECNSTEIIENYYPKPSNIFDLSEREISVMNHKNEYLWQLIFFML